MRYKNIIQKPVEIEGIGLHTGKLVRISINGGEEGGGIKFIRTDMNPHVVIPADATLVTTTNRGTTLKSGDASVSTIEHLLAALSGLNIEDAIISINGPEIPILDGSSKIFVESLQQSGLSKTSSTRDVFVITEAFTFNDPQTGSEYAVYPSDQFELNAILHFNDDSLGDMVAVMKGKDEFVCKIANCRTFVFLSEIEPLFDIGLIKGGDIENAIVIIDKKLTEEERGHLRKKLNKPNVSISEDGILSHTPLQYKNEPARHKLLDLMGDLTLMGRDIQAKIVATRPGHTSNVALAKLLKSKYLEYRKSIGRPLYDPNIQPVMNLEQIKMYLPHRYPFLLVDKVIEISDKHIVGIKNVTFNEGFFQGHFPGNAVFPGVLQMEALAQTGGILALTTVEDKGQWDTYFLKMENVKFKAKVIPGDTLILKMELMSPIRRGIIQMMGTAYVGNKLVSEGELTAQIVKRQNDQ
ncbi:MAG: bifunctional UDP-3-O-[3-hydroxymyristoyl] N-acetylglucosamine deacetylase/3-hydroxyacyl-ACP dehydratase [Saprospiraceae bacterium]|nr:bifunctional UDP-3-O-[3-hydroxymyristoyl] N-acetylglucosamine deacetylase/3-hydroxyacyl-ACP dehydratase [Saprospiraceae bacterium]